MLFPYHQDCEIIEDGKKHTLVLHNCKLDMTGEVSFQAANAKSAANLKVKGTVCTLPTYPHVSQGIRTNLAAERSI